MTKSDKIELNSVVVRKDDVFESALEDEIFMMSFEQDKYYSLNMVGSRIWEALDKPSRVADICDKLMLEFEVEPEICRREVVALIQHMADEKLVSVIED